MDIQPPTGGASRHLIAVVYQNGQWMYDYNDGLAPFEAESTDLLVAQVDFGKDTVQLLQGPGGEVHGIAAGYASATVKGIGMWEIR